jgi:hypothetical protein
MHDFTISVCEKEISDLKTKLASTKFPNIDHCEKNWDLGIYFPEFDKLINYWLNEYDWKKDVNLPPKSWIEKHFNLVHFSRIEGGGHFTAMENPDAYCKDFVKFAQLLKY